jgi:hypothetical protein
MFKYIGALSLMTLMACGESSTAGNAIGGNATGKAGSTARFAIVNDHLYTLAGHELITFSITDAEEPIPLNKKQLTPDVETLFPHEQRLYVGAQSGLYIYNLEQPDDPILEGSHNHRWACDPVVVQGTHAYVTLKSGGRCGSAENVLQIYDVSRPVQPRMVGQIPMFGPSGLAIDGNKLFVCDDAAGLKVFDASNPTQMLLKEGLVGQRCNDLIAHEGKLVATTETGIFQYDYRQDELELLSVLPWAGKATQE